MDFTSSKMWRNAVACFSLVLVVTAVAGADNSSKNTDYLTALEVFKHKEFRAVFARELDNYIWLYPDAANLDEIHLKLATIYQEDKRVDDAFFTQMQILYLYPTSTAAVTALDRVKLTFAAHKKYGRMRTRIEPILTPNVQGLSREMAFNAFLRDMVALQFEVIRNQLVSSCRQYLRAYPNSTLADEVLFWHAELLAEGDKPREALAEYLKLTYLHGSSLYVTSSKLKMAELFTSKLDEHQKAILTFEEFLLEFPDDPQAGQAQYRIGQILEKRKKRYLEALNSYTAVAERYPKSVEAVPALFDAARLYEDKFQEYDQAIRIYTEVVRDFPEDMKAPYAMAEAARIYEKELNDYYNAANVYYKVFGLYPESKIAPRSLFSAAQITEKRLNDSTKAIDYYRLIVDKYPDHKLAKKADKRVVKLSKVMLVR